jgi:hypothetical protein
MLKSNISSFYPEEMWLLMKKKEGREGGRGTEEQQNVYPYTLSLMTE